MKRNRATHHIQNLKIAKFQIISRPYFQEFRRRMHSAVSISRKNFPTNWLQFQCKFYHQNFITMFFPFLNHGEVMKYGVLSGPYFPVFGLNTERYGVSLRIQSECWKIWTRKNSVFGHFSRSECVRSSEEFIPKKYGKVK